MKRPRTTLLICLMLGLLGWTVIRLRATREVVASPAPPVAKAEDRPSRENAPAARASLAEATLRRSASGADLQPGTTPAATAQTLWGDEAFFNLRNGYDETKVHHARGCLTPSLLDQLRQYRSELNAFTRDPANQDTVPPVDEDPVFSGGFYEGPDAFQIGKAKIEGETARVPITLQNLSFEKKFEWRVIALFQIQNGVWLLDDVRFPEHESLRGQSKMVRDAPPTDDKGEENDDYSPSAIDKENPE